MRAQLAFFFILWACCPAQAQHHASPHAGERPHAHWHASPEAVKVAHALRQGGYIVFFRHAKTDMLATDHHPLLDMSDCSKQRNLSPAGVAASKEMGEAIKQLNISIGQVLSSPYCRCMDTARHAFGRVEVSQDLFVQRTEHGWGVDEAGEKLKKLVSIPPAPGTNTVLVAHIFNIQKSFGLMPEEGEAIVFRPDAHRGHHLTGRLTATQWGDLVRDLVVFKMDPSQIDGGAGHGQRSHSDHHGK